MRKITGLLQWQSGKLQKHYSANPLELFYATTLSYILLSCSAIILVFFSVFLVAGENVIDLHTKLVFLPTEISLLFSFSFSYIHLLAGNYNIARGIFTFTTVAATLFNVFLTGGFPNSIAIPVLVLGPIVVYLLYGRKEGIRATFIVPAVVMLEWALVSIFDIKIPDLTSTVNPAVNTIIVFFTTYSIIIGIIATYQYQNAILRRDLVIQHNKLAELANHDALTGLYNSRYFLAELNEIRTRPQTARLYSAIVYLDLDKFKPINDNYGHQCGDKILRIVGKRLAECIGENGLTARMGGDEFAILWRPPATENSMNELSGRLRDFIKAPILINGTSHKIAISIGHTLLPTSTNNPQHHLQLADQAMYRDKKKLGEKQTEIAPPLSAA